MLRQDREEAAVAWALDKVEAQLRLEPAHRLRDNERAYSWSLTAPGDVGVYVEAVRTAPATPATAEFTMHATVTRLVRPTRNQRRLTLPLDGFAARTPAVFYLVFETGGQVNVFETLDEPADNLESTDLRDGLFVGAFSDQGELVTMTSAGPAIQFQTSGVVDLAALDTLIRGSSVHRELAGDPHLFALTLWRST